MASPQLWDGGSSVVPLDAVPGSAPDVPRPVELALSGPVEVVSVRVPVEVVSAWVPVEVELVALVVGRLVIGGSVLALVGEVLAVPRSTGPPPASLPE